MNRKEANEYLVEVRDATEQTRNILAAVVGTAYSYYEGKQWIESGQFYETQRPGIGRILNVWNPDSRRGMRATVNRIASLVQKSAAATTPERMEVEALPPDRDAGTEMMIRSHSATAALNTFIDCTGFLGVARNANTRRCIGGTHGIALCVRYGQRNTGSEIEDDAILSMEDFDPTMLILDPACQKLDLWDHDRVIYTDVWTLDRIQRVLGVKLNADECSTIGDLQATKSAINKISEGRVFSDVARYSKTKGAAVYWMYVKGNDGRFGECWVGIENKRGEKDINWINEDSPVSPFGGKKGLPLVLLHGHRRADSMWSIGDATMLKDDQDRINATASMLLRQLQKSGGGASQWRVSLGALGQGRSQDDFESSLNNQVGGVIWYEQGSRDRPTAPPELVTHPPPQPMLQDLIGLYNSDMENIVHRPPVSQGQTKSHVADATYQTAIDQADQPLSMRVREDLDRYAVFFDTMLGTVVNFTKKGSPTTLAELRYAGFDDEDFSAIMGMDPTRLGVNIRIRESSVRMRSNTQKRQDLANAVAVQAIGPMEYRAAFAQTIDSPITDTDGVFASEAEKSALRVMLGEEWVPVSLGQYAEFFLTAFRKSLFDRRIQNDTEAKDRLWRAIQNQTMFEAALTQAQQPTTDSALTNAEPQPVEADDADMAVGRIIEALSGGTQQGAAQPVG